jgi:predicted nuclease with TOPRIM domain
MKIFAIHEKNAEILLEKEDTHNAIRAINCELNLIDEEKDWFLKAEKLRQRGEIAFKEGRVIESEKDLKESERILVSKKESFNLRRKQIESKYFWKSITGCCMSKSRI